jgi:PIN domain nuclease of toxin-antitoxin system
MPLLDTCTLLWVASDQSRLSAAALEVIERAPAGGRFVSSISAFEVGLLHARGRVTLPLDPAVWFAEALKRYQLEAISLDWNIAIAATQLPPIHRDPADRFIVATAIARDLQIISPDEKFPAYGVRTVW